MPKSPPATSDQAVGSFRAYFAFTLGCLFFSYAFLQRVAPSVMTADLMRDFTVGGAVLGSLSAFYFYSYASIQVPVGVLIDRYGPRRLMAGTLMLCALGTVLFAMADNLFVAIVGRTIVGAMVAFAFVGSMTIAAHWLPSNRFPFLVGLIQSTGMAGAILAQAPLSLAVGEIGWRATMMAMALGAVGLAVAIFLVVQDKPGGFGRETGIRAGLRQVIGRRDSWLCAIIGFTLTAPMLAFAGLWAVPWLAQTRGFDTTDASFLSSFLFFGWLVGSPIQGWASQAMGRRKPFFIGSFFAAAASLTLLIFLPITDPKIIGALMFINGYAGSTMVLCFANVREVNRPANAGAAMGLVNMFVTGSGAVFQPLIGWLLDLNWAGLEVDGVRVYADDTYAIAISSLLVSYGIGLAASVLLRETYCHPVDNEA